MISIATVKGAVRTAVMAYRVGVIVYELARRELAPKEPAPMPLSYRDVEHIRQQIASATSHKVTKK